MMKHLYLLRYFIQCLAVLAILALNTNLSVAAKEHSMDRPGSVVLSASKQSFNQANPHPGLFLVHKSWLWGFVNGHGVLAIPLRKYNIVGQFHNGLACVQMSDSMLYGYINMSGQFVVKPKYTQASNFVDSVSWAMLHNSKNIPAFVVIKKTENGVVTSEPIRGLPINNSGRMVVFNRKISLGTTNTKISYGVADADGKVVIPPQASFGYIGKFSEGLASIRIIKSHSALLGFIDRSGGFIITPKYKNPLDSTFRDGLAPVLRNNGIWSYIDRQGNVVFNLPSGVVGKSFHEGRAVVWSKQSGDLQYAYIDQQGNFITGFKYNKYARNFHEGLAAVAIETDGKVKCGFINHSGQWAIRPIYDWASSFDRGLAHVQIGNTHGLIDSQGNWIWKTTEK